MGVKSSLFNLAAPLMLVIVVAMQFPVKTNANSLRHGTPYLNSRIVTPSSPIVLPPRIEDLPVQRQRTVQDELSQVFVAAPAVSNSNKKGRKGSGDACIGPVCGLGLFFASIGLTFLACFFVIYVADKRYDRVHNSRRRRDNYYTSNRKRRPSTGHLDFRRNCTGSAVRSPAAMRHRAAQ